MKSQNFNLNFAKCLKFFSGNNINPLALLVAPLAAISLLAAAAAVAINPVLINVSLTGRKKRSTRFDDAQEDDKWNPQLQEKVHELQVRFTTFFSFFCEKKPLQLSLSCFYDLIAFMNAVAKVRLLTN